MKAKNDNSGTTFVKKQPDFGWTTAARIDDRFMTALLTDSRELKLLSQFAGADVTATRSSRYVSSRRVDSVCTAETIRLRAEAVTPVLKKILEIRPPRHWGINE